MISNTRYWFLIVMIVLVYITGMFVTLFENDSAQFAVMAMRMVQENDFLSLFKGPQEYLDKPHMHYWLAAISFKIFGIHDWAYRIPGILATLFAAYGCFGLGKTLYNTEVGKLSALVFMTAQTIVLAAIDVRTDAVLTCFTILAIWQLTVYIKTNEIKAIILGAIAAGLAFSTKGQIALLVIGFPLLCHLAYTRNWARLISYKSLIALVVFGIATIPMLYAYYHQFDLHPEKIIRGKSGRSGIFFIFWEQSFERLSGQGMGKNSSDYFFFFHTFLWVFLPWTVLGLAAFGKQVKAFVATKFKKNTNVEFLTVGGIVLIFIIISFAQFKLPHYLNITIPLFSVLTGAYCYSLRDEVMFKTTKVLLGVQYFILGVVFVATAFLCYYVFDFESIYGGVLLVVVSAMVVYYCLKREAYSLRIITVSVCTSLLLNVVLNTHFYPKLLQYQAGSSMAKTISERHIDVDNIYKISEHHSWGLDFYNRRPVQITSLEGLKSKKDTWVYVSDAQLKTLKEQGFDWDQQLTETQFRITRLQATFLNPTTRDQVLNYMHLVHIY